MFSKAVFAATCAGIAVSASAQEEIAQRNLAAPCAICHGTNGRSATKDVASLAGLPREHIAAQMRAFRDDRRPATVMHQIAKGYSDSQIDALAAWFAAQGR